MQVKTIGSIDALIIKGHVWLVPYAAHLNRFVGIEPRRGHEYVNDSEFERKTMVVVCNTLERNDHADLRLLNKQCGAYLPRRDTSLNPAQSVVSFFLSRLYDRGYLRSPDKP